MNDFDLIQCNQAAMLTALAALLDRAGLVETAKGLDAMAKQTSEYLGAKLNKTPLPVLHDAAKQTEAGPWPDDLKGTPHER